MLVYSPQSEGFSQEMLADPDKLTPVIKEGLYPRALDFVRSRINSPDHRFLDAGMGPGGFLKQVLQLIPESDLAANIFGCDQDQNLIEIARRGPTGTANIDLRVASCTDLPYADKTFNTLTCMSVLQWLNDNELDRAVSELSRVLDNDGQAFVSVINRMHLCVVGVFKTFQEVEYDWSDTTEEERETFKSFNSRVRSNEFPHSDEEYKAIFKNHGLHIENFETLPHIPLRHDAVSIFHLRKYPAVL
jgi:ubiquinone/menaquinone biosynthesis C-methylase UbiE